MPLPPELHLRAANEDDLPAIAGLRASVGWAAHDWALRIAMTAPFARCLLVEDPAGRAVAVGSGISYGALGFVGNMVVDAEHRRRGIGQAVLQEVTRFLEERGCVRLELFATADGRPLYARHGFTLTGSSRMAAVPRDAPLDPDPQLHVEAAEPTALDELVAYDTPRFGGDRTPVLRTALEDPERPVLVARREGAVAGYAWLRPDGPRVGPLIADAPRTAATLLASAFERAPEAASLTVNLPTANAPGAAWLDALGVASDPWDGRMARGPELPRRDETIYGNVVGALG